MMAAGPLSEHRHSASQIMFVLGIAMHTAKQDTVEPPVSTRCRYAAWR